MGKSEHLMTSPSNHHQNPSSREISIEVLSLHEMHCLVLSSVNDPRRGENDGQYPEPRAKQSLGQGNMTGDHPKYDKSDVRGTNHDQIGPESGDTVVPVPKNTNCQCEQTEPDQVKLILCHRSPRPGQFVRSDKTTESCYANPDVKNTPEHIKNGSDSMSVTNHGSNPFE